MEEIANAREGGGEPLVLPRSEHSLSRRLVDSDALKILFRLRRLGFTAYLTGGAVRDMLLGKTPKDFDIATDARPGQIKKHFANAFIIGRRFRLAHVRFRGGKVIEVATFRKNPGPQAAAVPEGVGAPPHAFGTPEEDAWRRDITINALFYDPGTATVIDHVGGLADLRQRRIRVIGDPAERFREDPVRIWRVIRYAARLDFTIGDDVLGQIIQQRHRLEECSPARLYEEFCKDLLGPRTRAVVSLLRENGILGHLLGRIGEAYESDRAAFGRFAALAAVVDAEKEAGRSSALAETAALFFWPWAEPLLASAGPDPFPSLKKAFLNSGMAVALPKVMRAHIIDILALSGRMMRALSDGRMRWSARGRAHYPFSSRLCFLASQGRLPGEGESFETLFHQAFPGRPTSGSGPRRRRRRPRRPAAQ
ncbi:MAG: poly(A) polymerase [Candidatus Aminicenantes bacterium]|nr:poly(A) polymerase [Candidatus Aminicenantes bacterium]